MLLKQGTSLLVGNNQEYQKNHTPHTELENMFIKKFQRTIIRLLLNTYIFPPTQTCGMTLSVSPVNTCMGVPSHAVSSPQFFSSDPIFISFREPRSLEESSNGPTTTWIYMDISCAFFTSQLRKVVLITKGGRQRAILLCMY